MQQRRINRPLVRVARRVFRGVRARSACAAHSACAALWALFLLAAIVGPGRAAPVDGSGTMVVPLDGAWAFAMDPLRRGESIGWAAPDDTWTGEAPAVETGWDRVQTPHNWTQDPRYAIAQHAWYRRSIEVPASLPARAVLRFGSVQQSCRVFVNGALVGAHEGGYTPFEIDVSEALVRGRYNLVALEVSNTWSESTLPGARPLPTPSGQIYPWWPAGGLTGGVSLIGTGPYLARHEITTEVSGAGATRPLNHAGPPGTARVSVRVALGRHAHAATPVAALRGELFTWPAGEAPIARVEAPAEGPIVFELPVREPALWTLDRPTLHISRVTLLGADGSVLGVDEERFGIRTFEVVGEQLLLNGQPIRLPGANRAADHPSGGTMDTPRSVEQDGRLLKEAGLVLSRLQHQPLTRAMLDWADENGLLVIQEASAWGTPAAQLASEAYREAHRRQMRETVEMSRNSPSVIGWSVGNEYDSWTPEGVAWTADMKRFIREELGDARPIVFASLGRGGREVKTAIEKAGSASAIDAAANAFAHSDILCMNWYGSAESLPPFLDAVHAAYPGKPFILTEYGTRADQADPARREAHLLAYAKIAAERPWIAGLSYWAFNDYRSMYPGSRADGVRPWGLVEYDRTPRALYGVARARFAPVAMEVERAGDTLRVTARGVEGLPSRDVRGVRIELRDAGRVLAASEPFDLSPGASRGVILAAPRSGLTDDAALVAVDPRGFTIATHPAAPAEAAAGGGKAASAGGTP